MVVTRNLTLKYQNKRDLLPQSLHFLKFYVSNFHDKKSFFKDFKGLGNNKRIVLHGISDKLMLSLMLIVIYRE